MSFLFTKEKIDKYYKDSFLTDLFNYFDIANGECSPSGDKLRVTEKTYFASLFPKDSSILGEDSVTPICYRWLAKERDYIFSALFSYLYIVQKSMADYVDKSEVFEFNKAFSFPETRDLCPKGYFDVVVALKEAMLAPTQNEVESYMAVLDMVVPYMNEMLDNFLSQDERRNEITMSVGKHIDDLRLWVATNTDEVVSLYGLLLRKESYDGLYYQNRYVMLESFVEISKELEIFTLNDLVENQKWAPTCVPCISFIEDPIIAHHKDIEFIIKYNNMDNILNEDDPLHWKETREEENQRYLYNTINNLFWQDEKFCENGKYGLRNCRGRIILPTEYEDCIGGLSDAYNIIPDEMVIGVKKDGKWGFVKRCSTHELVIPYIFDYIENRLNGVYLVVVGEAFGIISKLGKELITPIMLDIYRPTFIGDILYKHKEGYGLRLHNGASSTEYFEDVDISSGRMLMVRRAGVWGYIDNNAQFSTNRENAVINVDFTFNSDVKHIKEELQNLNDSLNNVDDIEIDHTNDEDYLPIEKCEDYFNIDQMILRAGTRMNFKEDSLTNIATVVMGFGRCILNFILNKEQKTFAIDMQHPYKLELQTNGSLDSVSSWNGHPEAKKALQLWLNQTSIKSGVRNWAECIYAFNHNRDDKVTVVKYAENKEVDFTTISDRDFDSYDFPAIEFED